MKKIAILSGLCVLLSAALIVWGFAEREEPAPEPGVYVLLMTEDRGTDAMQFKQGAQLAADELGARLRIDSVAVQEEKTRALLSFLKDLAETPFDGLILPACEGEVYRAASRLAEEKDAALACLFEPEDSAARAVLTDREEQGRQLARSILEADGDIGSLYAYFIDDADSRMLLKGLSEELKARGMTVIPMSDDLPGDPAEFGAKDVLISLSRELTEPLSQAMAGARAVWGVDPGDERVALLEGGFVEGLSFEMPYIGGYLAVRALEAGEGGRTVNHCPTRVVTKDTMYLSENVKLVFPLIQ